MSTERLAIVHYLSYFDFIHISFFYTFIVQIVIVTHIVFTLVAVFVAVNTDGDIEMLNFISNTIPFTCDVTSSIRNHLELTTDRQISVTIFFSTAMSLSSFSHKTSILVEFGDSKIRFQKIYFKVPFLNKCHTACYLIVTSIDV